MSIKDIFKNKFTCNVLFRFRDSNMYCFDVVTRELGGYMGSVHSELVIGQVFYFVKSDKIVIREYLGSYPLKEGDKKAEIFEEVKSFIQMCHKGER